MTKEDIINYLKVHKQELRDKYGIEAIGLFGSYARDEATPKSDIDIFVSMKPDLFALVSLKEEIENALQTKVDIIREYKYLKPFLRQMIQKDIIYVC